MQNVQEVKRLRAFVKDKFYPALLKSSTSIEDAKFWLTSFSNMVMGKFLERMKETNFNELKLEEKLDITDPNYQAYVDLLALFKDENIYSTRELIEGMKGEIEMNITNELKGRKLETLQTNWLE